MNAKCSVRRTGVSFLNDMQTLREREPTDFLTRLTVRVESLVDSAGLTPALEQLPSALGLGVGGILDLVPGRLGAVGVTLTLGDDPLQIQPAGGLEQLPSLGVEAGHPAQPADRPRNQPLQPTLPLIERQTPEIAAVQPEQVEGHVGQSAPG